MRFRLGLFYLIGTAFCWAEENLEETGTLENRFFFTDWENHVPNSSGWNLTMTSNQVGEFFYHVNYQVKNQRLLSVSVYGLSSQEDFLRNELLPNPSTNSDWKRHNLVGLGARERLFDAPFRLDSSAKFFQGSSSKLLLMGSALGPAQLPLHLNLQYVQVRSDPSSAPRFLFLPEQFKALAFSLGGKLSFSDTVQLRGQLGTLPAWSLRASGSSQEAWIQSLSFLRANYLLVNFLLVFKRLTFSLGANLISARLQNQQNPDVAILSAFYSLQWRIP